MATGSGWASVVVAPLAVLGAVLALRSPPARGAVLGLVAAVVLLWAVLQSAALSERFFVWLVPGVGYLAAAAAARIPAASVLGAGGAALALTGVLPDYTSEPTDYRQAAALVRRVDRSGGRSCVVGVGVPPMLGYLDARRQFEVVTDPGQLDRYDVVVVASWWPTTAEWFAPDRSVIAAAKRRLPHRLVLKADDPALVLSTRPQSGADGRPAVTFEAGSDPATIVLTRSTYEAAMQDERAQFALRQLASEWLLVFLGQSLRASEVDLYAELSWVVERFKPDVPHILLEQNWDPATRALVVEKPDETIGVTRVQLADTERPYEFTEITAAILGGAPTVEAEESLPLNRRLQDVYVPIPVAPESEANSDMGRGAIRYRRYVGSIQTAHDLGEIDRLLLIGRPGHGKSDTLARIAASAPDLALILELRDAHEPGADEDLLQVFLSWASDATAGRNGVPRLTRQLLLDHPWTFCLDGLDEVPGRKRSTVVELVAELVDAMPQHRWVVSSRRPVDLTSLTLRGFERYELLPDREWLNEFVVRHGRSPGVIAERVAALPKIADLLTIPRYAAEIVKTIVEGGDLPNDPLQLALSLADRGLHHEEHQLPRPAEEVRKWLGDLAFALEALGEVEIERSHLPTSGLSDDAVDRLVERTLLVESEGTVAFPAPIAQEARAAERLLRHPAGIEIAKQVAIEFVGGEPQVRPAWRHTLDLMLASGENVWREALRSVDPMGVARSLDSSAPRELRAEAAESIWRWYEARRIHMPTSGPGLRNDLDALEALAGRGGLPAHLLDDIEQALSSADSATRGNAVTALAQTGHCDVVAPHLADLIADPAPVVRRRAAMAAVECKRQDLAKSIAVAAAVDADELARDTLSEAAIALAELSDLSGVLDELPRKARRRAFRAVLNQWGRTQLLTYVLQQGNVDDDVLEEIASGRGLWTSDEVEALGEALATTSSRWMGQETRKVLTTQPQAALRGRLRRPTSIHDLYELQPLLDALSDDDLAVLEGEFSSAEELLSGYRQHWRRPADEVPTPPPPQAAAVPTLAEVVLTGDAMDLLQRNPSESEVAELPEGVRQRLSERIQEIWDTERGEGRSPALTITRKGNEFWATQRALRIHAWAAVAGCRLTKEEWLALATLGMAGDVGAWLHREYDSSYEGALLARIEQVDGQEMEGLLRAVPQPWSSSVAAAFAARVLVSDQAEELLRMCLAGLVDGHGAILKSTAPSDPGPVIDRALAKVGHCQSERRLLEADLNAGPPPPERYDEREEWLRDVRCRESGTLIEEAIRRQLAAGTSTDALGPYTDALNRTLGVEALVVYDRLMGDPELEGTQWLWYDRQRCIDALAERGALDRLPSTASEVIQLLGGP